MKQLFKKQIPYYSESLHWFLALADHSHPVWLDSNGSERGRYDILAAEPDQWFTCIDDDPHQFLQSLRATHSTVNVAVNPDIPFCGGLVGLLGYQFGLQLQGLSKPQAHEDHAPTAEAGWYSWAIIQDHLKKNCTFVSLLDDLQSEKILCEILATKYEERQRFQLADDAQPNLDWSQYQTALNCVNEYILDGDCYQINFSKRYDAAFTGDPKQLYTRLRGATKAPFSAYFSGSAGDTLSLSPERFVRLTGRELMTQPIKGTSARDSDPQTDLANAEQLRNSSKDKAENLMIVDLLRNDFGRVCVPGSIKVPELFELQSFAMVHHLVSTITGELDENKDALDLLAAVFPGGSITGAPKHRAMQIIQELEPHEREIYCGSIFYLSADGNLDSNILIRSLLCRDQQVYCWGGGGIVLDSTAESEWQEIDNKIGRLLCVLKEG
ncbi:MAG: aminodeoxychorismate synthase component I [Pseudomonadales bacterium]